MNEIEITGYEPGAIGRITELHGSYYHKNWDMGLYFEARVATHLAEFLSRFNPERDGAWFAKMNGQIVGAIIIDGAEAETEGARLRFFILAPECQGLGVGNRLMEEAVSFCKRVGFKRVYLTTFSGLTAARHLYEKYGFRLYHETDGTELTGNPALTEQKFELILQPNP
jgi:GNAT superfamily N-acetyltransferase